MCCCIETVILQRSGRTTVFLMLIFVVLGSLLCTEAKVAPVLLQTGTDLLLDLWEPLTLDEGHDLVWIYNTNTTVAAVVHGIEPVFFGSYKSRTDYFAQNHSLLVKNVQPRDSGVYKARLTTDVVRYVAEYTLRVQDPVSRVELIVKSCSSDRSNLTVICRTLDSLISSTFTCRNQTCCHDGGEGTSPGASLDVYLKDGSVICNHSNQVSWEKDVKKIEDVCGKTPDSTSVVTGISYCNVKIIVVSVGLFIMVCAIISVHVMEKLTKKKEISEFIQQCS